MQITGAVPIALVGRFTSSCAHATSLQLRTVSSALQAEQGRGLERQATAADAWCAARGLQIDDGLSDAGIAAFKGENVACGALGFFLAMDQAGALGDGSVLLVEAIDRLSQEEALEPLPATDIDWVGWSIWVAAQCLTPIWGTRPTR